MGIASTAIATSRKFTSNGEKKEEICFVDITFFARSAEVANQYLRKGSKILVEGRLSFDQWVDQNGQKRSKHSVVVESMQMLDTKNDNQGGGHSQGNYGDGHNEEDYNSSQSYAQPAQQSYNQAPAQQQRAGYEQAQKQSHQSQGGNAQQQARQMPRQEDIPVIDIDEDEIPFSEA
jgi:single-strand DNA-binding protein